MMATNQDADGSVALGRAAQPGGVAMVEYNALVNATINSPANNMTMDYNPAYPGLVNFSESYIHYHGYLAAIICIWGIAANLANIVVLTRKNMLSSTNMILMWLAVADLMTMTSYFPVSIHFYILRNPVLAFPSSDSIHWIRFMLFHINFSVVSHTIAIWLTITLAIFRYLFICYPTRGCDLCSLERSKLAIALVYASVSIICIPNMVLYTGIQTEHTVNQTYSYKYWNLGESSVGLANPFLTTTNYWIQAFLIKLIPCVLLVVLTILLIIAMTRANKRRMKLKSKGKKDESDRAREHNRTTGMLLAIVGFFLLTELPQGILTLCNIFVTDFFMDVYNPLGDVIDMLAMINNSVNFVLYCTMSRQFRETFMDVFCGCCPTKRPGWLKMKAFSINANGTTTTTMTTHV